jgi:hypothetical protein
MTRIISKKCAAEWLREQQNIALAATLLFYGQRERGTSFREIWLG